LSIPSQLPSTANMANMVKCAPATHEAGCDGGAIRSERGDLTTLVRLDDLRRLRLRPRLICPRSLT